MKNDRIEKVREALNTIYRIYGLQGESGTEHLIELLDRAILNVHEDIDAGHEEGLFSDCVSSLARHLDNEFMLANGVSQ